MTAFDEAWGLVKTEEPLDLHPGFTRSGHHGKDMVHPWRWTKGDDADFHVQLKGNNAGKVLKEPIPNSIGVATNPNVLLPDFARYMFEHIHNKGAYRPYINGAVVPFIRQRDLDRVLIEQMQQMWGNQQ